MHTKRILITYQFVFTMRNNHFSLELPFAISQKVLEIRGWITSVPKRISISAEQLTRTTGAQSVLLTKIYIQGDDGSISLPEENARKLYRKWDNLKHINDGIKSKSRPQKIYGLGLWSLSIKTKERLCEKNGRGLKFGVVITLKEMSEKNRIDYLIKLCMVRI